ncbi:MAG: hypothetical protein EP311_09005, partial [Cytophagales bacterium]
MSEFTKPYKWNKLIKPNWFSLFLSFFGISILPVFGQQFNTDNYLTMPHGTETVVLTTGSRNAGFAASYALLPNFEFFTQGFFFWEDEQSQSPQHFNLL